jgi:hypothetical protein
MFRDFLRANRQAIVGRAHAVLAALDPADVEARAGRVLDQLVEALEPPGAADRGAATTRNGGERGRAGEPVARLVHEHVAVVLAALELAEERGADLRPAELRLVLSGLEATLAAGVAAHQRARERAADDDQAARTRRFAHELRNKLYATTLAWSVLKGRGGEEEGADQAHQLVDRSIAGLVDFVGGGLASLRHHSATHERGRVVVQELVEEALREVAGGEPAGSPQFSSASLPSELEVEADWAALMEPISRLLRAAVQAGDARGQLTLRATEAGERVLLELQGGADSAHGCARMATEVRPALEALGADLDVREAPGGGWLVTLSLPRVAEG